MAVEYEIDSRGYNLIVSGPVSKWLHVRLMCIPGAKYLKRVKQWMIPRCWLHIVKIVITTHLNNLSKKEEEDQAKEAKDKDDANCEWLESEIESV